MEKITATKVFYKVFYLAELHALITEDNAR